jgi:hypothetical protein
MPIYLVDDNLGKMQVASETIVFTVTVHRSKSSQKQFNGSMCQDVVVSSGVDAFGQREFAILGFLSIRTRSHSLVAQEVLRYMKQSDSGSSFHSTPPSSDGILQINISMFAEKQTRQRENFRKYSMFAEITRIRCHPFEIQGVPFEINITQLINENCGPTIENCSFPWTFHPGH